jgi:hypothetical protein
MFLSALIVFIFCMAAAQAEDMTLVRELGAFNSCSNRVFQNGSLSKSTRKEDLETAAHAIVGDALNGRTGSKVYS